MGAQGRRRAARRQPSVRALRQARQSDCGRRLTRAWSTMVGPVHAPPDSHHPTRWSPRAASGHAGHSAGGSPGGGRHRDHQDRRVVAALIQLCETRVAAAAPSLGATAAASAGPLLQLPVDLGFRDLIRRGSPLLAPLNIAGRTDSSLPPPPHSNRCGPKGGRRSLPPWTAIA